MLKKITDSISLWGPVLVYMIFIYILSSRQPVKSITLLQGSDKIFHIGEYSILGFLLCRAIKSSFHSMNKFIIMFISIIIGVLYGIFDEIHQYFVPYRTADVFDAIADFGGTSLGVFCYMRYYNRGQIGKN